MKKEKKWEVVIVEPLDSMLGWRGQINLYINNNFAGRLTYTKDSYGKITLYENIVRRLLRMRIDYQSEFDCDEDFIELQEDIYKAIKSSNYKIPGKNLN